MRFNKAVAKILKTLHTDYFGFADLRRYQNELTALGGNIVRSYKYGISVGLVIPDSIVDFLPESKDMNIACEYKTHGYDVLNQRLNIIVSTISSFLNGKGYKTLPIAVADRTNKENAIPTVSHKMIAHIAGLGWIGKNCLLITPKHGPRVRFISILTNAPVKAIDKVPEQKCGNCTACVMACPANAIKGTNFILGESREIRLDFAKCQKYLEKKKATQLYGVCGMCLYVCPYGKKKK